MASSALFFTGSERDERRLSGPFWAPSGHLDLFEGVFGKGCAATGGVFWHRDFVWTVSMSTERDGSSETPKFVLAAEKDGAERSALRGPTLSCQYFTFIERKHIRVG